MVDVPGGGDRRKSKEQPDAKQTADAPRPVLRGSNPDGDAMSLIGDEERAMPNARRNVAGGTEGK
jgi:hypothetical protein